MNEQDILQQQQQDQQAVQTAVNMLDDEETEYTADGRPVEGQGVVADTLPEEQPEQGVPEDSVMPEGDLAAEGEILPEEERVPQEPVDDVPTEEEQQMEELMNYEGEYTSGVARALDNIGNVFKDSPIGDVFHKLAEVVEQKFGSVTSSAEQMEDVTAEVEDQIMDQGGERASEVKDAAVAASQTSPEAFVTDLEQTAQAMQEGTSPEAAGDGSLVTNLQQAVSENASLTPVETGEALQLFNNEAVAHIDAAYDKGSAEHQQAMDSLSTVMGGMTSTYYEAVMENEASGVRPLSEDDKAKIDTLNVEGVAVSYSEYLPGDDITVGKDADAADIAAQEHEQIAQSAVANATALQKEKDQEVLKASDGSLYADVSESEASSNEKMEGQARMQVLTDGMIAADKANEHSDFDHVHIAFRQKAGDLREASADARARAGENAGPEVQEQTAESYMSMMHGVQAYNDAAVQAIQEKYADDPRGMARATNGLAKTMRNMVGDAFDLLKDDDAALGFLSPEDKVELDQMSFTGVNVKYSEYHKGMNLKTGEMPSGKSVEEKSLEELADPDQGYTDEERMLYGGDVPMGSWAADVKEDKGSAFVDQPAPSEFKPSFTRERTMSGPSVSQASREDRVAMASAAFGTVLQNDQKAKDDRAAALGLGE